MGMSGVLSESVLTEPEAPGERFECELAEAWAVAAGKAGSYRLVCDDLVVELGGTDAASSRHRQLLGALHLELSEMDHRHKNLVAAYYGFLDEEELKRRFAADNQDRELFAAIILKEFNRSFPGGRIGNVGRLRITGVERTD